MKNKRCIQILSFILTLALLACETPVLGSALVPKEPEKWGRWGNFGTRDNFLEETPAENIFKLEGDDTEFILLDSFDDEKSAFYIMTKKDYGTMAFDPDGTQRFDPEDQNNIGYFLNNGFLSSMLPAEMVPYLDKEHIWDINEGGSNGNCPAPYSVQCPVTLLDAEESITYMEKYGQWDDIGPNGWWLRTPFGFTDFLDVGLFVQTYWDLGQVATMSTKTSLNVRPVFYLNRDFFQKVKVDLTSVGANVRKALNQKYSWQDFQGEGTLNYADDELCKLGVFPRETLKLENFEKETYRASGDFNVTNGKAALSGKLTIALPEPAPASAVLFSYTAGKDTACAVDFIDVQGKRISAQTTLKPGENVASEIPVDCSTLVWSVELNFGGMVTVDDISLLLPVQMETDEIQSWTTRTGGVTSTEESAVLRGSDKKEYVASIMRVNPDKAYVTDMTFETALDSPSAFTVRSVTLGQNGEVLNKNSVIKSGGVKPMRDYHTNVVNTKGAAYMLFVLEIDAGASGTVNVKHANVSDTKEDIGVFMRLKQRRINPKGGSFFTLRINCDTPIDRTYEMQYSLTYRHSGEVVNGETQRLTVHPASGINMNVPLVGLEKGDAYLDVRVYFEDVLLKTFREEVMIIEPYEKQYLHALPGMGLSAYVDQLTNNNITVPLFNDIGFNRIRMDYPWSSVENKKGKYDFSHYNDGVKSLAARNVESEIVLVYDNKLYGANIDTTSMQEGYAAYAKAAAQASPEVSGWEIWNEPDGTTWPRQTGDVNGNPFSYVQLAKMSALAIKETNPNARLSLGQLTNNSYALKYLREMFELDVAPYFDTIGIHPYYGPAHIDDDGGALYNKVQPFLDVVKEFGGWKDVDANELGWPDYWGDDLRQQASVELLKTIVQLDDLEVAGMLFTMTDTDESFGMFIKNRSNVKPSYGTITTFRRELAGAQYIGKADFGDNINVYLYRKNNQPVAVAWSMDDTERSISFDAPVRVQDCYANDMGYSKTVSLDNVPRYIKEIDPSWFERVIRETVLKEYNAFEKEYGRRFEALTQEVEKLGELDSAGVKALVQAHFKSGLDMMKSLGGEFYKPANTAMLFDWYKAGCHLAKYYGCIGNEDYTDANTKCLAELQARFDAMSDGFKKTQPMAYEFLRHATKYKKLIDIQLAEKDAPEKRNNLAGWDVVVGCMNEYAAYALDNEPVKGLEVNFNIEPARLDVPVGQVGKANVTLYNRSKTKQTGKLELIDAESGEVASSKEGVTIEADGKTLETFDFSASSKGSGSEKLYNVRYTSGDGSFNTTMQVRYKPSLAAALEPSSVIVEDLEKVTVKLTNKTNAELSGALQLGAPEGWKFSETEQTFKLKAGETGTVSFNVAEKERVAFNQYIFDVKAVSGDTTLLETKVAQDFNVVVKAEGMKSPVEFTGDISDWSDAYPTYLALPKSPESYQGWHDVPVAARIFQKWDENYMYLLADVYDFFQSNQNTGSAIWQGDDIQLYFDQLNNKTDPTAERPQKDDNEIGFALTSAGLQGWEWSGEDVPAAGKPSNLAWGNVLRDDLNKNTRYYIRIPKEKLRNMTFEEGAEYGFNLALNDAQVTGMRENMYEITDGIIVGKWPSRFRTWILVGKQENTENGLDKMNEIFNSTMKMD